LTRQHLGEVNALIRQRGFREMLSVGELLNGTAQYDSIFPPTMDLAVRFSGKDALQIFSGGRWTSHALEFPTVPAAEKEACAYTNQVAPVFRAPGRRLLLLETEASSDIDACGEGSNRYEVIPPSPPRDINLRQLSSGTSDDEF